MISMLLWGVYIAIGIAISTTYGVMPMIAYYVGGTCHAVFWILQNYYDDDDDGVL